MAREVGKRQRRNGSNTNTNDGTWTVHSISIRITSGTHYLFFEPRQNREKPLLAGRATGAAGVAGLVVLCSLSVARAASEDVANLLGSTH